MDSLYAALRPKNSCSVEIRKHFLDQKVPEVLGVNDFHTTVVYSTKAPENYSQVGKVSIPTIYAYPTKIECWPTSSGENAVVLRLHCPALIVMHEKMMENNSLSYDYDEYKPHITISYDVGNFKWENIQLFNFPVEFNQFYDSEVDEDWRSE